MLNKQDIVEEARSWIDVKWRHQGRSRAKGVDCAGLIVNVAKAVGARWHDDKGYSREPSGFSFIEHFEKDAESIPIDQATDGDILIFSDFLYPCHSAILSMKNGCPYIIHSHAQRRKVVEEPYSHEWPLKVRRAFRFLEDS